MPDDRHPAFNWQAVIMALVTVLGTNGLQFVGFEVKREDARESVEVATHQADGNAVAYIALADACRAHLESNSDMIEMLKEDERLCLEGAERWRGRAELCESGTDPTL